MLNSGCLVWRVSRSDPLGGSLPEEYELRAGRPVSLQMLLSKIPLPVQFGVSFHYD
jgi:hypothetical protein